jgi:hypothetical protein
VAELISTDESHEHRGGRQENGTDQELSEALEADRMALP